MKTNKFLGLILGGLLLAPNPAHADIADHKFSIAAGTAFLCHAGYELHHAWKQACADLEKETSDITKTPKKPTLKEVAQHIRWKYLALSGLVAGSVAAAEQYPHYADRRAAGQAQQKIKDLGTKVDALIASDLTKKTPAEKKQTVTTVVQDLSQCFADQVEQGRTDYSFGDIFTINAKIDSLEEKADVELDAHDAAKKAFDENFEKYYKAYGKNLVTGPDHTLTPDQEELLTLNDIPGKRTPEQKARQEALSIQEAAFAFRGKVLIKAVLMTHEALMEDDKNDADEAFNREKTDLTKAIVADLARTTISETDMPGLKTYFAWLLKKEIRDAQKAAELMSAFEAGVATNKLLFGGNTAIDRELILDTYTDFFGSNGVRFPQQLDDSTEAENALRVCLAHPEISLCQSPFAIDVLSRLLSCLKYYELEAKHFDAVRTDFYALVATKPHAEQADWHAFFDALKEFASNAEKIACFQAYSSTEYYFIQHEGETSPTIKRCEHTFNGTRQYQVWNAATNKWQDEPSKPVIKPAPAVLMHLD